MRALASVFLSYDHEDMAIAGALAEAVEKAGHSVWYDRHIHGGAQYSRKIEQALGAADAVVVLWSGNSIDSAWVRDEAADGRDSGKLVPLTLGGVSPPMGFRQFQTIDLGDWKGRGKVPKLAELLAAIEAQAEDIPLEEQAERPRPKRREQRQTPQFPRAALLGTLLALALVFAGWKILGSKALPVVAVEAATSSPQSQAAANDLFVKLGSLAQIGEGKWQLVDRQSAPEHPTFVFRAADSGSAGKPQATVVMLDGKDGAVLWSRQFEGGAEADLKLQLALTAGRVLRCALDSRESGGLRRNLLKLFLDGCALLAEASYYEAEKGASILRQVVQAEPKFAPAWGPLIVADLTAADIAALNNVATLPKLKLTLQRDISLANKAVPDLPELMLPRLRSLPPTAYGDAIEVLEEAVAKAPDNTILLNELAGQYPRVGRTADALNAARRVAELDPLSPNAQTALVLALAYDGRISAAREELAKLGKTWPGTGAWRDAMWAFHLRFGDPDVAMRFTEFADSEGFRLMFAARRDPSADKVAAFVAHTRQALESPNSGFQFGQIIQPLGEFGQIEEIYRWLDRAPTDVIAKDSYILFRPHLAILRRDPRFMALADRIGLVRYWSESGVWPDFCRDPQLPYDCKAEAAKYGA